jgi:hypothetical protein
MEQTLIWYHLALFLHLCALLAAMSAAGIAHYAEIRMHKARVSGELLEWATLLARAERVFPFALLTLVAAGAYMVSTAWPWSAGWVDMALVAVVALFGSGIFLATRVMALQRALAGDPDAPISTQALHMANSLLTRSMSYGNTALVLGVVFIMVTKLDLLGSLISLVVAYAIGVALANTLGHTRSAAASPSQREEASAR